MTQLLTNRRGLETPEEDFPTLFYPHNHQSLPLVLFFAQRRNKQEWEAHCATGTTSDGATSYNDGTQGGEDFDWSSDD